MGLTMPSPLFVFQNLDSHQSTLGIWFASSYEVALGFAQDSTLSKETVRDRVVTADLNISNPKIYSTYDDFETDLKMAGDARRLHTLLVLQGYNGIRIDRSDTDGLPMRTDWVAFQPNQIKITKSKFV